MFAKSCRTGDSTRPDGGCSLLLRFLALSLPPVPRCLLVDFATSSGATSSLPDDDTLEVEAREMGAVPVVPPAVTPRRSAARVLVRRNAGPLLVPPTWDGARSSGVRDFFSSATVPLLMKYTSLAVSKALPSH